MSLLKDLEQNEVNNDNNDDFERTPTMKWHKVNFLVLDRLKTWDVLKSFVN